MRHARLALFTLPALLVLACGDTPPEPKVAVAPPPVSAPPPPASTAPAPPPPPKTDQVGRMEFNRLAVELAVPIFWAIDKNTNSTLDPDELAVYWGLDANASLAQYVKDGAFTPKFFEVYTHMVKRKEGAPADPMTLDAKDAARRALVRKDLAQGRPTLVMTDFTTSTPEEKKFVAAIARAAAIIERLYQKEEGTFDLTGRVPPDDTASRSLFFRDQGPKCAAPLTQNDPACSAIPEAPKSKLSGLYPAAMLGEPKFCEALTKKEDGKKEKVLMDPFTVVTGTLAAPEAIPYHSSPLLSADMKAVSEELKAAAAALGDKEGALKAYLTASAQAFTDDKWWPADEAWAKMDAKNSRFYIRVAPDEVYAEPCSTKALFHVSFGLINQGSLKWQQTLDPIKNDMEKALAAVAGAPYKARAVTFKLPDFVDIAINAGDSRPPSGATVGQSLPNFGPVANEGRGRTVAMTNFYTDPDSVAALKETTESLFCADAMSHYTTDQAPMLMSVVLHEAAHNLGPSHQYKTNGKIDREVFGGPLASTLEELKAQTAAMFFAEYLVTNKKITRDEADKAHVRDIVWGFGHISRGMYDEDHHPKNYSQLAAIQLGWLMKDGAVVWKKDDTAANGKDKGCFSVALDKIPASVKSMMTEVGHIKGAGDKPRAEKLLKEFVDVTGDKKKTLDTITDRMLRAPKASFVYAIKVD